MDREGKVGEVLLVGHGDDFSWIVAAILPVGPIVGELDGEFFICSYGGCLDDIDDIPMQGEFAVVVVRGEVLLEIVTV